MTYYDYHQLLLNEAVMDLRVTLKRKIKTSMSPRALDIQDTALDNTSVSNVIERYNKVNNMLINGKVKADQEVDFAMLEL